MRPGPGASRVARDEPLENLLGNRNIRLPADFGQGLGLSPLVVLLSLLFWGWVFGAIGMLLAIPLTMCVVIVLDSQPETRRIAHLLGARPQPDET